MKSITLKLAIISLVISGTTSCEKEEPIPGGNATSCQTISSDITTTTTLTNRVSDPNIADYCITNFISVKNGAGLIIEPGVVIEFSNNAGIEIGTYGTSQANAGYIIADGIPADKITFTGAAKTPGTWRGIAISSTNSDSRNKLDHCIIEYAGSQELKSGLVGFGYKTAIGVGFSSAQQSGLVNITNCIIRNNDGKGYTCRKGSGLGNFVNNKFENNTEEAVFMSANGFEKLDPLSTFTDNGFNGFYQSTAFNSIEQLSDTISHYWRGFQGRFQLNQGVRLATASSELHIQQGTELIMGADALIHAQEGLFESAGVGASGSERVYIHGETPGVGTWDGIYIESGLNNRITNTDISGGGKDIFFRYGCNGRGNIGVNYWAGNTGKVSVTNCNLRNSGGCGIYVETTSSTQQGDLTQSGNAYYGNVGNNICN